MHIPNENCLNWHRPTRFLLEVLFVSSWAQRGQRVCESHVHVTGTHPVQCHALGEFLGLIVQRVHHFAHTLYGVKCTAIRFVNFRLLKNDQNTSSLVQDTWWAGRVHNITRRTVFTLKIWVGSFHGKDSGSATTTTRQKHLWAPKERQTHYRLINTYHGISCPRSSETASSPQHPVTEVNGCHKYSSSL